MGFVIANRLGLVCVLGAALALVSVQSHGQTAANTTQSSASSFQQLVLDIQSMLTELGYQPGPVDGAFGERTRQAIRRYQSNTGLSVDGHPSESLRQHLRVTTGSSAPAGGTGAQGAAAPSQRTAAWEGQTLTETLLRIAPSEASAGRQQLAKGTSLEVIRRQGAWLEVRVKGARSEGWVKQVSVRASAQAATPPKKESGGFFANLARGVSRLLGGSSDAPQNQGNVTVGIRGLAPEDLANAIPNPGELDKMESFRADRDQAYRFAGEEQLTAQTVEYIPAAEAASGAGATSGGRRE